MILRAASGTAGLGRYRTTASLASLLIANAIPLAGVLFFGWSLITILVLYWLENGIVGLWNIPRIALARGRDPIRTVATDAANQRAFLIPFFVINYGIFWFGHGFFLLVLSQSVLFGGADPGFPSVAPLEPIGMGDAFGPFSGAGSAWGTLNMRAVAFAGLAMLVSHGVTFLADFVRRREYEQVSPRRQMLAVYGRVVVLHIAILFGGIAIAMLGSPIWILVFLVVGKTLFDLSLDRRAGSHVTS